MKIANYLGRTLFQSTLLALCLLLAIDFFFGFINELRFIGTGDYRLLDALWFLSLEIPQNIGEWFALSLLLGSLLGLGALNQQQELLVLRVHGLSLFRLWGFVLRAGIFMVLLIVVLNEGVAPFLSERAQELKAFKMSSGQAMLTTQGTWLRDGQAFIHVRSIRRDGVLLGVTQYELSGERLNRVSIAERASFEGDHWHLEQVQETEFLGDRTQVSAVATKRWESKLDPALLRVVGVKHLEALSIFELWQTWQFRQENNLENQAIALALWRKVLQPLSALVLLFVAFPFVFGPLREATAGLRWLAGLLLGFSFYILNAATGPLSLVIGLSPFVGAILPSLIFLGLGVVLVRRVP